jgi:hypothetical protein
MAARVLFDKTISRLVTVVFCGAIIFELVAGLLTQTRSIQVSVLVSFLALFYIVGRKGLLLLAIFAIISIVIWGAALSFGAALIGPQFASMMEKRYAVLADSADAERYSQKELRPLQIMALFTGADTWVIWGSALGDSLQRVNADMSQSYTDVSIVYMASRFGLLGELLLVLLTACAGRIVFRERQKHGVITWVRAGLAASLCGAFVASIFANTFGYSYTAVPGMLLYCLALVPSSEASISSMRGYKIARLMKRNDDG